MSEDEDGSMDYTPYGVIRGFVLKNIPLVLMLIVLASAVVSLFFLMILPNESYRLAGTITRIDNIGLDVKVFMVDFGGNKSLVGMEIAVGSGLCTLDGWRQQCFVGAPVEVTYQSNMLGQESFVVSALIRGAVLNGQEG